MSSSPSDKPNAVILEHQTHLVTRDALPLNAIVLGSRAGKNLPGMTQVYRDFRDTYIPRKKREDFRTLCFDFFFPFFAQHYDAFKSDIKSHSLPFFLEVESGVKYKKLDGDELNKRLSTDLSNSKYRAAQDKNNGEEGKQNEREVMAEAETTDLMSLGTNTFIQSNVDMSQFTVDKKLFPDQISSADSFMGTPRNVDDLMHSQQNDIVLDDLSSNIINPIGVTIESHQAVLDNIHDACKQGSITDLIRIVANDNSSMESINEFGQTALMIAIQYGHSHIVKQLIDFDANLNVIDKSTQTILHYACKYGSIEVVKQLKDVDVVHFNAKTKHGATVFHYACLGGHEEIIDVLLTKVGIDAASVSKDGMNALHFACCCGNVNIVAKLLSTPALGYDVMTSDKEQKNAFHYACMSGFLSIVQYLQPICENSVDKDGKNGLHLAAERGNIDVVRYLIGTVGIPVESRDSSNNTVLHVAIAGNYKKSDITIDFDIFNVGSDESKLEVVKYLISEASANVLEINHSLWNALHIASRYGRLGVVEYLIKIPIVHDNIEAPSEHGWTALHHAIISGNFDVVKCLLSHGAKVGATNNDKWTVLHYACRNGYYDATRSLIEDFNADINAENKFGQTPRDVAKERNHQEIDRYLEAVENGDLASFLEKNEGDFEIK